jgi:hypothetical protein
MSKRVAAYGPTVLVGLFATAIMLSTNSMLSTNGAAFAADDCLTAPTHPPGPGAHWRVRNDTANNRKCWYLVEPEAPAVETSQRSPDPAPEPGFGSFLSSLGFPGASAQQSAQQPDTAARPDDVGPPRAARQPSAQADLLPKPHRPPPARAPAARADDGTDALFQEYLQWEKQRKPQ